MADQTCDARALGSTFDGIADVKTVELAISVNDLHGDDELRGSSAGEGAGDVAPLGSSGRDRGVGGVSFPRYGQNCQHFETR
jgi:hypothetical protein